MCFAHLMTEEQINTVIDNKLNEIDEVRRDDRRVRGLRLRIRGTRRALRRRLRSSHDATTCSNTSKSNRDMLFEETDEQDNKVQRG